MRATGMSLLLFALLLSVAAADQSASAADSNAPKDLHERFASWRAAYGRTYPNAAAVRGWLAVAAGEGVG